MLASFIDFKEGEIPITFIENHPENTWSLDRGTNDVISQVDKILPETIWYNKIHDIIYIQENPFPSL